MSEVVRHRSGHALLSLAQQSGASGGLRDSVEGIQHEKRSAVARACGRAGSAQAAFISPLRDLAIRDLALYCHRHGLRQVRSPAWCGMWRCCPRACHHCVPTRALQAGCIKGVLVHLLRCTRGGRTGGGGSARA